MKKLTINSKELLNEVLKMNGCANEKHPVPLLQNIRIAAGDGKIMLETTNLETTVKTVMENDTPDKFCVLMNYQQLKNILKGSANAAMEISLDGNVAYLSCGTSDYQIPVEGPENWPTIKEVEDKDKTELDTPEFVKAVKNALSFTEPTDNFMGFSKVRLFINNGKIKVTGITGHFIYEKTIGSSDLDTIISLSGPSAGYLASDPFDSEKVQLGKGGNMVYLSSGNTEIFMLEAEGQSPKYDSVIPSPEMINHTVEMDKKDLKHKIGRITGVVASEYQLVVLKVGKENTDLIHENTDFNFEGEESLPSVLEGEPIEIGFNAKVILKAINVCEEDKINLEIRDSRNGVLINEENTRILIMPYAI